MTLLSRSGAIGLVLILLSACGEPVAGSSDAADAGVVHGDLRPERFLITTDHILVEGFGVPWIPEDPTFLPPNHGERGSFAGDVYSMTAALQVLGRNRLQGELQAAALFP